MQYKHVLLVIIVEIVKLSTNTFLCDCWGHISNINIDREMWYWCGTNIYTDLIHFRHLYSSIPQMWKLDNYTYSKPNKYNNQSISYIAISLFYTLTQTLKKTILLYITNNFPHIITVTLHSYKSNHSIDTTLPLQQASTKKATTSTYNQCISFLHAHMCPHSLEVCMWTYMVPVMHFSVQERRDKL